MAEVSQTTPLLDDMWRSMADEAAKHAARPGPGFENICRECFGCTIEWPGIRRCVCGTGKPRPEMFPKSRGLIADAIEEIENGQ